jgi:putative transposase
MLETGKTYHLYNRGNNRENLFYKKENYHYFIRQFDKYLSNYLDVYAYCLLPNHFHFLIKVKDEDEILRSRDAIAQSDGISTQSDGINYRKIISEQFRRFFISYSQAINKQEKRVGSLFQKCFKIKEVNNDSYFSTLVFYIHANPQKHGLIDDFKEWNYSSYHSIITDKTSKIKKINVIDWFGNVEEYKRFHSQLFDFRTLAPLELED